MDMISLDCDNLSYEPENKGRRINAVNYSYGRGLSCLPQRYLNKNRQSRALNQVKIFEPLKKRHLKYADNLRISRMNFIPQKNVPRLDKMTMNELLDSLKAQESIYQNEILRTRLPDGGFLCLKRRNAVVKEILSRPGGLKRIQSAGWSLRLFRM